MNDPSNRSPWAKTRAEILESATVARDEGLSAADIEHRRAEFGPNTLREAETRHWWEILGAQFRSVIVLLLAAAGAVAFAFGEVIEGVSIIVVLAINALIGFVTELRARKSMEGLQKMGEIEAHVRRDGEERWIPAANLVPGDIVILQAGNVVPADLRILESATFQVDESTLTGESVPVEKDHESLDEEVPLAERANMLYKGTSVTRGTAEAVVVSTGMDTELGKISASLQGEAEEKTPLQEKLDALGRRLVPFLLVVAAIVLLSGWFRGQDLFLMVETAIALAIATIPEGLPVVATLVLARGMWRMADRNALIRNLASVETLGSTNVICTDKTGTLTENRMTVGTYELAHGTVDVSDGDGSSADTGSFGHEVGESGQTPLTEALEVGVLCNNATTTEAEGKPRKTGDPMEQALLEVGEQSGMDRDDLLEAKPVVREVPFDPADKMMATYHRGESEYQVAVKGAPEAVIEAATAVRTQDGEADLDANGRETWEKKSQAMAEDGYRVLALATKHVSSPDTEPYENLALIGLVGLIDPPRAEVKSTIQQCQRAGLRIVMVTGDHPGTATNIARRVGLMAPDDETVIQGQELADIDSRSPAERTRLTDANVFARVAPENKLDLIALHQGAGSIVAMTGDGVNDAPALKAADIGVAMGKRGTQVAREAADMILRDDNFTSIYHAVREGRVIFGNIRKFVLYLMSCNLSELLTILIASILGFPLPLLPLQILFLNVVNDIFPAFALGASSGSEDVMDRPPRDPEAPIMTRTTWTELGFYGLLISVATVGAFVIGGRMHAGGMGSSEVVTMSFLTLAFAQLWHVFTMRDLHSGILRNEVSTNRYVWGALLISAALVVSTLYLPGVSLALKTTPIGMESWAVVLGMSLLPLGLGQASLELRRRYGTPAIGTWLEQRLGV